MKYNSMKKCAMIAAAVTVGISAQSVMANDQITASQIPQTMVETEEIATQKAATSAPREKIPFFGTKYRVIATTLNVRSGPGTSYSKIGSYRNGQTVWVKSISRGWAKLSFGTGAGYVYAKCLERV